MLAPGVNEAIQKKYLRALLFSIHGHEDTSDLMPETEDGPQEDILSEMGSLVEQYQVKTFSSVRPTASLIQIGDIKNRLPQFNFQYPDADSFLMTSASIGKRPSTKVATCKADVVNQMQIMMRMLVTLTNTLAPLPQDRWLTMKVGASACTPSVTQSYLTATACVSGRLCAHTHTPKALLLR